MNRTHSTLLAPISIIALVVMGLLWCHQQIVLGKCDTSFADCSCSGETCDTSAESQYSDEGNDSVETCVCVHAETGGSNHCKETSSTIWCQRGWTYDPDCRNPVLDWIDYAELDWIDYADYCSTWN